MGSRLIIKGIWVMVMVCFCLNGHSQSTSNYQIKRLKRAIFIFNFAEHITYKDLNAQPDFIIGVLGKDRTVIDLKALAEKRHIKNKPVKVVAFESVKDITNVDVVYVNHDKNFDVNYILNKISGNNTLLITEDYPYNTSMINIINVGDGFQYEINEAIMARNNISAPFSLRQNAVSSADKWKQFFQNSESTLQKTKIQLEKTKNRVTIKNEEIKSKDKAIKSQKEVIGIKQSTIETQNESLKEQQFEINELQLLSEFQEKKYSEKLVIERQLEEKILKQLNALNSQETQIKHQKKILEEQEAVIASKETKLAYINTKFNTQRTINYLLTGLILLALVSGGLFFKNYFHSKKLNRILKEKNNNIYSQSLELTSKNRELEEFAYITSHDLKEPLATISGLIALLKDDYKDKLDEDALMSMEFIDESSKRMTNLIESLLEYSRLGKTQNKTQIDCNVLLDEVTSDLSNSIQRHNAKVAYKDLPTIFASKVEIRTVFANLINNGVKFKKPNVAPYVRINCKTIISKYQDQELWQFEVADNGIGIAEKHKEKVFAIFQRLHSRETYEGTGIGLAFCKKIIESLGGQIWFESQLNHGTSFFFTIPKKISK
ncbi:hypothetical protein MHTCC0001_01260 [Flavobacteriaceae bacterium MHTCC 0001]